MSENVQTGFYDIVKLCKGSLVLNLPAYDSSSIDRRVEIPYGVSKIRVPSKYALGVFVNGTLQKMYEEGYFKVEPVAAFEKEAANIFAPIDNKKKVVVEEDILNALRKNNRVLIKKFIEESEVNRNNLIVLARENIGDLSTSMIKDLETMLGVELTVENE